MTADRPVTEPRTSNPPSKVTHLHRWEPRRCLCGAIEAEAAQGAAPPPSGWKTPGDPSIDGTDFDWSEGAAPRAGGHRHGPDEPICDDGDCHGLPSQAPCRICGSHEVGHMQRLHAEARVARLSRPSDEVKP